MAIKHIRRYKRDQKIQILLFLLLKGDDEAHAVIYHITDEEWILIDTNKKYTRHVLPPVLRGLKYIELPYRDFDALWDQGDIEVFYIDKIE